MVVLRDSKGRVVAHLMGILTRTTTMLSLGIQPVFIFDGAAPELKADELAARRERRLEAESTQASTRRRRLPDGSKDGATHCPLQPRNG